ncbi:von Willebrand factor type A [Reticulomyxa filosa]|uniref:von Willebrand factor type A n=1 Tax=Reticulomyxa filosa TaxID=46433 RepID=X6N6T7_RETFI|nr:von Willebrand factor type A [Reticulomyxa filosa]|eukprot:ETO21761.1 von Willebrand factor type A [Reticulomyxa filosa]
MWKSRAEALGWPNKPISFAQISLLGLNDSGWSLYGHSEWGAFKYAHGNPDSSNSGRLSVIDNIFAHTNATTEQGLSLSEVDAAQYNDRVIAVEQSVTHLGMYVCVCVLIIYLLCALFFFFFFFWFCSIDTDLLARMKHHGPNYLDAVATYESNVALWNKEFESELRYYWNDTWVFIYLSDGTFWVDQPLCVLDKADWATSEQVEAARLFVEFASQKDKLQEMLQYGIRPYEGSGITDITCCNSIITKKYGTDPPKTLRPLPSLHSRLLI